MLIGNKVLLVTAIGLLSISTSGCATYRSSFDCGDSLGGNCMSMEEADRMIASGESELYTNKTKKCRGKGCRVRSYDNFDELPELKSERVSIEYNSSVESK